MLPSVPTEGSIRPAQPCLKEPPRAISTARERIEKCSTLSFKIGSYSKAVQRRCRSIIPSFLHFSKWLKVLSAAPAKLKRENKGSNSQPERKAG
jgi:hypothetical protein